jgi:hypothetical protein
VERTIVTITPANVISIGLCGLLFYWIMVGAGKAYMSMTGKAVGAGS